MRCVQAANRVRPPQRCERLTKHHKAPSIPASSFAYLACSRRSKIAEVAAAS